MSTYHIPVLTKEVNSLLQVKKGAKYIDATLGGGGHTGEILEQGGIVLGIDQDEDALKFVQENQEARIKNHELVLVHGNFKDIHILAEQNNFTNVSGILFDLGVSSFQMDSHTRGFSIKRNAPLDMRMDVNSDITAADIVNRYSAQDLTEIFMRYGEEEQAEIAAEQILKVRQTKKIETTGELVSALALTLKKSGITHPATKIFQALRIEVNSELEALKLGLTGALQTVRLGGNISVISFHSLEDRITKRFFSDWENKALGTIITKKPITATQDEVRSNPRARSAKLRVFSKL